MLEFHLLKHYVWLEHDKSIEALENKMVIFSGKCLVEDGGHGALCTAAS